jgi:hypothetical protein
MSRFFRNRLAVVSDRDMLQIRLMSYRQTHDTAFAAAKASFTMATGLTDRE